MPLNMEIIWYHAANTPKGSFGSLSLFSNSHGTSHHPTLWFLHSIVFFKPLLHANPGMGTGDKIISGIHIFPLSGRKGDPVNKSYIYMKTYTG